MKMVTTLRGVVVTKPHIHLLRDTYAIDSGLLWACSTAGCIARGRDPQHAYTALMQAFEGFRAPLLAQGIFRR